MANRPRLDSWKEIAAYLGRDIRTVIRWEERRRLPVYRVPGGGPRPRVFAYPDEIDRWLEQGGAADRADAGGNSPPAEAPLPPRPSPTRRSIGVTLGGLGLLLAAGIAWFALHRAAAPPSRLTIAGKELLALDASGSVLWRYPFDASGFGDPPGPWYHIGDLDADGDRDVLASLEVRPPGTLNQHHGDLIRFNSDGLRRWSFIPDDRIAFREGVYEPPWAPSELTSYIVDGDIRFAWSVHHFTWWPGLLITLDASGHRLRTFVNSGWIRRVWPSPGGRHLFFSGVSHAREAYVFGVLDAANPAGHSPESPGSPTECVSCPTGGPLQYIVFPRTDVGREQPFPDPHHYPTVVAFEDGVMQVQVIESGTPDVVATIYELVPTNSRVDGSSPPYRVREARFSDSHWNRHRRLESEGRLNHAESDCPERGGLDVQDWSPAGGWTGQRVTTR